MRYKLDLELLLYYLSRICRAPVFRSLVRVGVRPLIFCGEFLVSVGLIIANFGELIVRFKLNCSLDRQT